MSQRPIVPVVGFDLDLTLVDSAVGIARTLRAALAEDPAGTAPPDAELRPYIGIPLDLTVRAVAPGADVDRVTARYRELYPVLGVPATTVLPGAAEAFRAIRARGGRVLVVSAKVEAAVHAVLEQVGLAAAGLAPDVVVGGLFAGAKGVRLGAEGAQVYVGDHPGDMEAAAVAGAVAVAVGTGSTPAPQLVEAGADVVLPDLTAFAGWFDGWFDGWSERWRASAARRAGLDDQPGERQGEPDRAQQGQRREAAGG
jgi:phosphoglycolate phosphatase